MHLLYWLLVIAVGIAIGVSIYGVTVLVASRRYVYAKEAYGDYVISVQADGFNYDNVNLGLSPHTESRFALSVIKDSASIINEINRTGDAKALGIASALSVRTAVVNAIDIPVFWYRNKTPQDVARRFKAEKVTAFVVDNQEAPDIVIGVDSEAMLRFYEDSNLYKFHDLKNIKGAYISDTLAETLKLEDESEYISILTTESSIFLDAPIGLPIAGYFTVLSNGEDEFSSTNRMIGGQNAEFLFLDMEYYNQLYPYSGNIAYPEGFNSISMEDTLFNILKSTEQTSDSIQYSNIWVKDIDFNSLNNIVSNSSGQALGIDSSFDSFGFSRVRYYFYATTVAHWTAYAVLSIVLAMLLRAATLRVVEYNELQIQVLYSLGTKRNKIFKDLFIQLVLTSGIVVLIVSFAMSFIVDFIIKDNFVMLFKIKSVYSMLCSIGFMFLNTFISGHALWECIRKNLKEITGGGYA